jgi:chemotaxis protein MotA
MFAIIGIVVVFGAVLGGFLMEKGPLLVLMQPSEFLIIAGAALGTLLSGNPLYVLKKVAGGLAQILKGPEVFEAEVYRSFEDDVHPVQQGAKRGTGRHRGRY